jgi:hypothetical protein
VRAVGARRREKQFFPSILHLASPSLTAVPAGEREKQQRGEELSIGGQRKQSESDSGYSKPKFLSIFSFLIISL